MISGVLSDAAADIRENYLSKELFDDVYSGDIRKRIEACLDVMDLVRKLLDSHPDDENYKMLLETSKYLLA